MKKYVMEKCNSSHYKSTEITWEIFWIYENIIFKYLLHSFKWLLKKKKKTSQFLGENAWTHLKCISLLEHRPNTMCTIQTKRNWEDRYCLLKLKIAEFDLSWRCYCWKFSCLSEWIPKGLWITKKSWGQWPALASIYFKSLFQR